MRLLGKGPRTAHFSAIRAANFTATASQRIVLDTLHSAKGASLVGGDIYLAESGLWLVGGTLGFHINGLGSGVGTIQANGSTDIARTEWQTPNTTYGNAIAIPVRLVYLKKGDRLSLMQYRTGGVDASGYGGVSTNMFGVKVAD